MSLSKKTLLIAAATLVVNVATAKSASAQNEGANVAVAAFGIGMNTIAPPPGNPINHHVMPQTIRIKQGGVVNFMVAGFHQLIVYLPGTGLNDISVPVTGTFINDLVNVYYQGINPAGGPLGTAGTTNPSNGSNRNEPVVFLEPGTYLAICNIRGHFLDGMYAWVIVSKGNDKDSN